MGLKLFFKKMNSLEVDPRVSIYDSWLKGFFLIVVGFFVLLYFISVEYAEARGIMWEQ